MILERVRDYIFCMEIYVFLGVIFSIVNRKVYFKCLGDIIYWYLGNNVEDAFDGLSFEYKWIFWGYLLYIKFLLWWRECIDLF